MSRAPPLRASMRHARHPAVRNWFWLATGFAFAAVLLASLGVISIVYVHGISERSEAFAERNVPRMNALADARSAALRASSATLAASSLDDATLAADEAARAAVAWAAYDEARATYDALPGPPGGVAATAALDEAAQRMRADGDALLEAASAGRPADAERVATFRADERAFAEAAASALDAERADASSAQSRLMAGARKGIEAMLEVTVMLGIVGGGLAFALVREAAQQISASLDRTEESTRLKARFINKAAHELKTPLTPMGLQLALLARVSGVQGDARVQRAVQVLERNYARLSGLVGTMVDVALLESSAADSRPVAVPLAEALDRAAEHERVRARVDLRVAAPLEVLADSGRLEKALGILLLHAADMSPPGARVGVVAEPAADGATVRIRYDGPPLTAAQASRLFEAFGEEESGTSDEAVGLRLYLCRALLASCGGTVSVEPTGSGAVFAVSLPAPQRRKPRRPAARASDFASPSGVTAGEPARQPSEAASMRASEP